MKQIALPNVGGASSNQLQIWRNLKAEGEGVPPAWPLELGHWACATVTLKPKHPLLSS